MYSYVPRCENLDPGTGSRYDASMRNPFRKPKSVPEPVPFYSQREIAEHLDEMYRNLWPLLEGITEPMDVEHEHFTTKNPASTAVEVEARLKMYLSYFDGYIGSLSEKPEWMLRRNR